MAGRRGAPRSALESRGDKRTPPRVRRSERAEAEGSLTWGTPGRAESSPDNDGTGRHDQTIRVRQARWKGVREEPATESSTRLPPARTWSIWAGLQRAPATIVAWGTPEPGYVAGREATVKACGVTVARLLGHSWTPTPSRDSGGNLGTNLVVPPSSAGGRARRQLTPPGWGGGPVVVRGRESLPHGEGAQRDRSIHAYRGGRR